MDTRGTDCHTDPPHMPGDLATLKVGMRGSPTMAVGPEDLSDKETKTL